VDLAQIAGRAIWGKSSALWSNLLGAVRYFVVWLPMLYAIVSFALAEAGISIAAIANEEAEAHRPHFGGVHVGGPPQQGHGS
jgi:hypothetical protein